MATQQAKNAPMKDIGVPDFAWSEWGQGLRSDWFETSPELVWPQSVLTYGRMRHDPQIKGVLSSFLYPLVRANWAADPGGCRDEVVQHVADDLGVPILGDDPKPTGARRRGVIWKRHLRQLLTFQPSRSPSDRLGCAWGAETGGQWHALSGYGGTSNRQPSPLPWS